MEVLRTDGKQPSLEKRFSSKESVLKVTPMFLKTPQPVGAMLCLYGIALMLVSLIERRIRLQMQEQQVERLPPAAGRDANEETDLAHHHGLVSWRPSGDHRTLRQGGAN